ncbi:MAG TPA: hypothetical protein VF412_16950 [Bdellovibrio sp.]|uniref:hypothetical protein n=1 Tax=Bdellovibrio sp. TaxID=28201 RepID=UPI002F248121
MSEYLEGGGIFGEGSANLVELSVSRAYTTIWKKEAIDLSELVLKRWVERWTLFQGWFSVSNAVTGCQESPLTEVLEKLDTMSI